MKKLLLLSIAFFTLTLPAQKTWQTTEPVEQISIRSNQLPIVAQTFINTLFPSIAIKSAIRDIADDEYDVTMTNGYEMIFDNEGYWLEIDAPDNAMFPCGIIEQIVETDVFISLLENEIAADPIACYVKSVAYIPNYGYVILYSLPNREEENIIIDTDGNIWGWH